METHENEKGRLLYKKRKKFTVVENEQEMVKFHYADEFNGERGTWNARKKAGEVVEPNPDYREDFKTYWYDMADKMPITTSEFSAGHGDNAPDRMDNLGEKIFRFHRREVLRRWRDTLKKEALLSFQDSRVGLIESNTAPTEERELNKALSSEVDKGTFNKRFKTALHKALYAQHEWNTEAWNNDQDSVDMARDFLPLLGKKLGGESGEYLKCSDFADTSPLYKRLMVIDNIDRASEDGTPASTHVLRDAALAQTYYERHLSKADVTRFFFRGFPTLFPKNLLLGDVPKGEFEAIEARTKDPGLAPDQVRPLDRSVFLWKLEHKMRAYMAGTELYAAYRRARRAQFRARRDYVCKAAQADEVRAPAQNNRSLDEYVKKLDNDDMRHGKLVMVWAPNNSDEAHAHHRKVCLMNERLAEHRHQRWTLKVIRHAAGGKMAGNNFIEVDKKFLYTETGEARSLREKAEYTDERVKKLLEDLYDNAEERYQRLAWVDGYLRGALGGVQEPGVLQAEIKPSAYERAVGMQRRGQLPGDLPANARHADADGEDGKKFRFFADHNTKQGATGAAGDSKSILDFEPHDDRFRKDVVVNVHKNMPGTQTRHMALSDVVGQARIEVLKSLIANDDHKDQLYVVRKTTCNDNHKNNFGTDDGENADWRQEGPCKKNFGTADEIDWYKADCGADAAGHTDFAQAQRDGKVLAWSEKLPSGERVFHYDALARLVPDISKKADDAAALDWDGLRLCLRTDGEKNAMINSFAGFPAPLQELLKNRLEDRHVALYLENPLRYGTHVLLDDGGCGTPKGEAADKCKNQPLKEHAMSPLHRAETFCRSSDGNTIEAIASTCGAFGESWSHEVTADDEINYPGLYGEEVLDDEGDGGSDRDWKTRPGFATDGNRTAGYSAEKNNVAPAGDKYLWARDLRTGGYRWRESGNHWGELAKDAHAKLFNALEISLQDAFGWVVKKVQAGGANTLFLDRSATLPGVALQLQDNLRVLAGRAMSDNSAGDGGYSDGARTDDGDK